MKSFLCLLTLLMGISIAQGQPCQSGKLDPRVASALKTVLGDLKPVSQTTSLEQIRAVKIPTSTFPASDVQQVKVTKDSIRLQIYNPTHGQGLPIIISYHPGGFVTPMLPFMEYECWRQANAYQAIVFAVNYRVAPEHPYPAAVNDAYNAFTWIATHGQQYGGDTSRIIVLGQSAGANLAAVVCQKAQLEGLAGKIILQVLNCPSTDNPRNAARYPSYQRYASGYFLTKAFCQYYIGVYAPKVAVNNAEVAPIQRKAVAGLPPAVVITAEFDPLRDEGYAYAERLRKAGVRLWYRCFPGQIHCLVGLPADAKELLEVDRLVRTAMHKVLVP